MSGHLGGAGLDVHWVVSLCMMLQSRMTPQHSMHWACHVHYHLNVDIPTKLDAWSVCTVALLKQAAF